MWTVGLTIEIKLRFQISTALHGRDLTRGMALIIDVQTKWCSRGFNLQLTLNLRKMLISDKISKDNLKETLLYPVLNSETFLEKI